MDDKAYRYITAMVAIVIIGAVLIVALMHSIDSALLGTGMTIIGTIIGYIFKVVTEQEGEAGTHETPYTPPPTPSGTP